MQEEDALKDRETPKLKKRLILFAAFLLALMYITMGFSIVRKAVPFSRIYGVGQLIATEESQSEEEEQE